MDDRTPSARARRAGSVVGRQILKRVLSAGKVVLQHRQNPWSIPAAFIDPKWDLMYFVEVIDKSGTGRMFPDFNLEAPYVIVPVKR